MFDVQLFFGFPVDDMLRKQLATLNPRLLEYFINNDGDYLHEVQRDATRFLGKIIGADASLQQLELLRNNIASIVSKMVPEYFFKELPLVLFAYSESSKG